MAMPRPDSTGRLSSPGSVASFDSSTSSQTFPFHEDLEAGMLDTSLSVVSIADGADVAIIAAGDKARRFMVLSENLIFASQIWKDTIFYKLTGGQTFSAAKPMEIYVNDNIDVDALHIILCLIHGTTDRLRLFPVLAELITLGTLIDKFKIKLPNVKLVDKWLDYASETNTSFENTATLTVAAALLQQASAFRNLTASLVFDHKESMASLLNHQPAILSPTFLLSLEEQRRRAHICISKYIIDMGEGGSTCGFYPRCTCRSDARQKVVNMANSFTELSLQEIWKSLLPQNGGCANSGCQCYAGGHGLTGRDMVQERRAEVKGLCLHCVKEGSDRAGMCTGEHGTMN